MNPAIELFRGIAAWMVMTAHYAVFIFPNRSILNFLWTGVDLFFVISGFVFAPLFFNWNQPFSAYLARRFFRIYPLYAASLVAYFFITPSAPEKLDYLIHHFLFLNTIFSQKEIFFYNPAYWSLPVEIEFYLLLPVLALLWRKSVLSIVLLCISASFLKLYIASNTTDMNSGSALAFANIHITGKLLEFMAGIALYNLHRRYPPQLRYPLKLMAVGVTGTILLGLLCLYFVEFGDEGINKSLWLKANFTLLCAAGYAFVLYPFLTLLNCKRDVLVNSCLFMGTISYGVYLFHSLTPKIFHALGVTLYGATAYWIYSGVTIFIAFLFYHLLEHPCREYGRLLANNGTQSLPAGSR